MRIRGRRVVIGVALTGSILTGSTARAQDHVTIQPDVLLYGDNTEFHNPFRKGETIFGAAVRVVAAVDTNERIRLSLGIFGNQRFGSDKALEQVRPVISLTVRGRRSTFMFGTLPAPAAVTQPFGPDRGGPHALLPPMQRESLSFERPYEAGIGWTFNGGRIRHSMWLEWQRLNTPEHRERFDGGFNEHFTLSNLVSLPVQLHVVHQGGQLYASGPVADSAAAAVGVDVHGTIGAYRAAAEAFGLVSRNVPDRSRSDLSRDGVAFFARVSGERAGWRVHLIAWRGRNFIKDEGDPNYLSIRRGGERYQGTRDYSEAGVARRFTLAPAAILEVSGRIHRVEQHYEYSYRIISILSASWRVH